MPRFFIEKMMMCGCICIEINIILTHHHLARQPGVSKLIECVIDGCQRYWRTTLLCRGMDLLGGDMLVPAIEQKRCQQLPLPRQAQARLFQQSRRVGSG